MTPLDLIQFGQFGKDVISNNETHEDDYRWPDYISDCQNSIGLDSGIYNTGTTEYDIVDRTGIQVDSVTKNANQNSVYPRGNYTYPFRNGNTNSINRAI